MTLKSHCAQVKYHIEASSDDDMVRDLVPPTLVKVPQKSKAQRKREFEEFERRQSIKRQNWEEYLKCLRPNGIPPWEANDDQEMQSTDAVQPMAATSFHAEQSEQSQPATPQDQQTVSQDSDEQSSASSWPPPSPSPSHEKHDEVGAISLRRMNIEGVGSYLLR